MNANVTTSEKQIKENKENAIAKSKEAIKNSQSISKSILDIDLNNIDADNLKDLLNKSSVKINKEVNERFKMYKFETLSLTDKEEKRKRTKIRKQRNKFIENVLYFFQTDKKNELAKEIKEFISFYKSEYCLNDFSLKSLANDNSDKDTKEKIVFMLKIISLNQTKENPKKEIKKD